MNISLRFTYLFRVYKEIFDNLFFATYQIRVLSATSFFPRSIWLIFYSLDPDPRSQNVADPRDPDPDPKHCPWVCIRWR